MNIFQAILFIDFTRTRLRHLEKYKIRFYFRKEPRKIVARSQIWLADELFNLISCVVIIPIYFYISIPKVFGDK